jgi:manganese/zinc/iron transport system substrate-binding protein
MKKRVWILLNSLILSLLMAGCGGTGGLVPEGIAGRQIKVVTTTSMITDLVKVVGGDRANVRGLMGPGIDPHLYKATEGNLILLAEADMVFYNGLHLEAKMADVFERMQGRVKTVAVTDRIDRSVLFTPPQFKGNYDPHVWFDVALWMSAVEVVRDAFIEIDPTHAQIYRANAERYLGELRELHSYVKAQAVKVPKEQRVIITSHDAFNYFGRAYGFEVRGLQGVSTATEAGVADVQDLARFLAERKIPAVFVESSVSPRSIEAVQAAVRARGFDVRIGGQLFSDALGDPGTPEGTYIGMVRHNIDTVVAALSGSAYYLTYEPPRLRGYHSNRPITGDNHGYRNTRTDD